MSNGPRVFPADLRTLIFDTALGSDGSALQNQSTAQLPDGASARVIDTNSLYVFVRDSQAVAVGTSTIAPANGPGRWVRQEASVTAALQQELYVIDNWNSIIFGYTPDMLAESYSGDPSMYISFDDRTDMGLGHGMCVKQDGSIVFATSEGAVDPNNGGESWWEIPYWMIRSGNLSASPIRRLRVDEFTNWASHSYGARSVCELPNGYMALTRGYVAVVGPGATRGIPGFAGAPVSMPDFGGVHWDIHVDPDGTRLWMSAGNALWSMPIDDMMTGGVVAVDKVMQGSNVSGTTDTSAGVGAICFDLDHNLYVWDYNGQRCQFFTAAQVDALTSTPSNPAPTRSFTIPTQPEIWSMVMGVGGDMWFVVYQEEGLLVHLSAEQVLSSGPQVPDRTVAAQPYAMYARYAVGYGAYQR